MTYLLRLLLKTAKQSEIYEMISISDNAIRSVAVV